MTSELNDEKSSRKGKAERGSALVMAIFVMVLLTGLGTALLFLGENEVKMSQASVRTKSAFFLAEAAIENGRALLWDVNRNGTFDDDLTDAAGADGVIDVLIPDDLAPTFDGNGNLTGFTGFNDDVPIVAFQALGNGAYGAFLSNDPVDGRGNLVDSNERVLIAGVGVDADGAIEIVEAIVLLTDFLPTIPPATITMLGPTPGFGAANSKVKNYVGDDCAGAGVPGLYVPIVGAIGEDANESTEDGCCGNPDFDSDTFSDLDVFADLTDATEPTVIGSGYGPIDPDWTECENLRAMVLGMKDVADTVCADNTTLNTTCPTVAASPTRIVYGDGDLSIGPTTEEGTLVATGTLTMTGNTDWAGLILVVGEGSYRLNGAGNGVISGGMIVADIAGPDNIFGNDDDCTGGDDGFDRAIYDERGGGNAGSIYCSVDLVNVNPVRPYDVVEFLQH